MRNLMNSMAYLTGTGISSGLQSTAAPWLAGPDACGCGFLACYLTNRGHGEDKWLTETRIGVVVASGKYPRWLVVDGGGGWRNDDER